MAKQSMFDDPQSRSFAIRILNEEDAEKGKITVSRNVVGVLDKDFIIQAAVAVDFLPPEGKEGVFYLLPDDTLWLFSGGLYICVSADVDKDYVDAKFNAAVAESKQYTDSKLDYTGVTDVSLSDNASTLTMTESKVNLKTGVVTTEDTAFPVANESQAGVINASTYQSIANTAALVDVILDGTVVVTGLSETPTQSELTAGWKEATGEENLINRAYVWSPEYSQGYTYFENVDTWYMTSSGGGSSISVAPFTNSSFGTVKGVAADGQIFAESNGTGSVYGWDALKTRVTNNETALSNKVDKVAGKGLSTEDYTTAEKTKLASVESGATRTILDSTLDTTSSNGVENRAVANAINDLNTALGNKADTSDLEALDSRVETVEGAITSIEGDINTLESGKVDKVAGKGLSTNDLTDALKTKLDGIAAGAEVNVQSDWNVSNISSDAFIKNKPTKLSAFDNDLGYLTSVPSEYMTESEVAALGYQTASDVQTAISGKADSSELATVAFSGDFEDLTNIPAGLALYDETGQHTDGAMTQRATTSALAAKANSADLATVATSGSYLDLTGTPNLANVATSGSYNDLSDTPTPYSLPIASNDTLGGVKVGAGLGIDSGGTLYATGGGQADAVPWGNITGNLSNQTDLVGALDNKANVSDLATVATSGDYEDLINTPTPYSLPTASAETLGGVKVGANLSITNGVLSADAQQAILYNTTGQNTDGAMTQKATTDALADKANISDIPTNVGDLTNDAGYITKNVNDLVNYTTSNDINTALAAKASTNYVNTELAKKADTTDLEEYTKTENLATVATTGAYSDLIGTPTIPTIPTNVSAFTNDAGYLVESDITTLRTSVATNTSDIAGLESSKVDKVSGKGLSTNDFTNILKTKLDGIEDGADANVQSDWNQTVTTADDYIKNKPSIPTKVSDLTNDSGFITSSVNNLTNYYTKSETYTQSEVDDLLAGVPEWTVEVVNSLPAVGQVRVIYLVPVTGSANSYDEYIWVPSLNDYDKLGDASIDLDNYYTKTEVDALLSPLESDISDLQSDLGSAQSSIGQLQTDLGAAETKLNGIEAGAEVNIQADWNVNVNTSDAYIKNKPTTVSAFTNDANYVDATTLAGYGYQTASDVATAISGKANSADLATVATSGSYNDLSNKPEIPVATSDLLNDSNFVADASYVHTDNNFTTTLKNKLDGIASGAEVNVQSDWNEADTDSDAYIANKPSIPTFAYNSSTETLTISV